MKTRKKTKLCLQCNGVNPMSASHCAYCGAVLAMEESSQEDICGFQPSQQVMSDLFAVTKDSSSYVPSRSSQPFVQTREPHLKEESVTRPLYSVFDQPQTHQIGHLRDELMEKPQRAQVSALSQQEAPSSSSLASPSKDLVSKLSHWFQMRFSSSVLEMLATTGLVTGSMLGSLALLTLIFEENGQVVLSWSSHRAPWFFISSIVLLLLGGRALYRGSK